MNLNDFVHHFPSEPKDQIPRDNLINRITKNFGPDCVVQAVYGESNIGKTNFLAQFCRYYSETAISYFIGNNPLSQLQEEFLYCICNQINFIFGYEELPIHTSKNDLEIIFDRLTNQLVRKIKKADEKFFIVVDGLEHGLAGSNNERIIDIFPLPISSKGPYVLISIDNKNLKILENSSIIKIDNRYELLPFNRLETKIFLNNLDIKKEDVDILHEKTKGNPGFLREVKDYCLRKGIEDISEISSHIEKVIADQVEMIYEQYQSPNIDLIEASAIFPTPVPISIISLYIHKPENYVNDFLKSNDVLKLVTDSKVDFIKESIRNGLLEKNKNKKIKISKKFVSIIGDENNNHLIDSYTHTLILRQAEEYDKSLALISNPKIIKNLSETDDVTDIIRSLETVLDMASEREDYEKTIELTLKLTILKTLFTGNVNSLEVEALIAIGKEEEAIRKAHSIPEIINRIRMLARAYTSIQNKSIELPNEALEELKELISHLHMEEINKEIIKKLAFDLFPIMQEEAINLIESAFRNVEDKNIFEITASLKSANEIENIPQIIKNPNYGFLIGLFSPHLVKLSFSDIKAELEDIEHTRTKEYLIRNWCLNNTENKSLILGFNYWYELIIEDSDFTLPLENLQSICFAIKGLKSEDNEIIIRKIEVLASAALKSPSEEWVNFLVNIAEFYHTNEIEEKAIEKIFEAHEFIVRKVSNLDSKVFCFARLLRSADFIFEDESEFINSLKDKFHDALNQLLSNSADQFEILTKTIRELALYEFQFAYSTAIKLNTSNNRKDAYSLILKTLITSKGNSENISDYIAIIFGKFSEIEISYQLNSISKFIVDNEFVLEEDNYQILLSFAHEISDPYLRSKILINFAQVIYAVDKELSILLADEAISSWEKEIELKLRLKLGFQLVIGLSNIDINRARTICSKVQRNYLDPGTTLVSGEFDHIYKNIIILVIRTFTKENVIKSDIIKKTNDLICGFPSKFTQIELFSQVGASLYRIEEIGLADDIVRNYVIKNIDELESRIDKSQILPLCFPIIYLYDNKSAEDFLEDLSEREKDLCWLRVIKWSLTRNLLTDPTDFSYQGNPSDLHTLRDISIEALGKIQFDSYIYQSTVAITECVLSSLDKKIDLEQSLDILRNLEDLIRSKLPDKDNIQHPGYKIISLSRIQKAKSQIHKNFSRGIRIPTKEIRQGWQEVFNSITEVENISDKVYILCLCAEDYYYWAENNAFEKLNKAEELIVEIPSILDRQNRFTVLAETYDKLGESKKATQIINDAVDLILQLDLSDTDNYLDLLIQAAYGINTELANELVSRLDKRIPPHSKFSADLEKNVRELIEAPNEIMSYEKYEKTLDIALRKSSKKLLRDLLIGRSTIYGHNILSRWLITSSYFGFKTYFAVANWVFESNRLERVLDRIETENYINLVSLVLDIGKFISPGKRDGIPDQILDITPNQDKSIFVFTSGEREDAKEFVFDWIKKNCTEQLIICDPYFGFEELEFISYSSLTCKKIIITTDTHLNGDEDEITRRVKMKWKKYSSGTLRNALLIIVPKKSTDQFHDRTMVSESIGLNLGQSLNGLGKKTGAIKIMTQDETEEMKREYLHPLLNNRTWFNKGIKPIIISFG